MSKPCDTHLSDTDREPLTLGLIHSQIVADSGEGIRPSPNTVSGELGRNKTRGYPKWLKRGSPPRLKSSQG
jgi:hypothetical protein